MAYSKKANKDSIEEADEKPYELVVTDADTPVFRASKFLQEDYIIVTHKPTNKSREFKNKTEFYGHWKKKDKGWLSEINQKRVENNKKPFLVESFEIEEHVRLISEIEDYHEEGLRNFDFFIGNLKGMNLADDYKLLIGGKNNFRYELAESLPYKGDRLEKPLMFEEIKEAIIEKYKSKVEIVEGKEVDDEMAIWGNANEAVFQEQGYYPYILAYIDKDLNMIKSPSINYDKPEEGITEPTDEDAMRHYCKQLLIGDKAVDNIAGLPNLVPELREEYGVRKGSSLGDATALSYLESAETCKELLSRVVKAYISYYGLEEFDFKTHRGKVIKSNWLSRLQETAILIYMNPYEDPTDYHITITLDEYGVDIPSIVKEIEDAG